VPALVSTLCICIVFVPMFLLSGVARYLFVPLAEAVVFAMLASYILSRTLVPTMAMYLLKAHDHGHEQADQQSLHRFQQGFERGFEQLRGGYHGLLTRWSRRKLFIPVFLGWSACPAGLRLVPFLGQDFFPSDRQRPVHPASARQDRHPHRGNGAPVRSGRGRDPQGIPARASSTTSSTTSACPTAASTPMHNSGRSAPATPTSWSR
jgi:hypothetical protein